MSKRVTIKDDVVVKDFSKGKRRFKKARFEKAKSIHTQLEKKPITNVSVTHTEELRLQLERIEVEQVTRSDKKKIAKKLVKFQTADIQPKTNFVLKIIDYPGVRAIVNATKSISRIEVRNWYKVMKTLVTYHLRAPKLQQPLLLHNDFHRRNVLRDTEGDIYFIDLESCIQSRRYFFFDIMQYAIDPKTLEEDKELLTLYEIELKQQLSLGASNTLATEKHIPRTTRILLTIAKNNHTEQHIRLINSELARMK